MGRSKKAAPMTEKNIETESMKFEYKPSDPSAREQHMISLAVSLAEKQLREGTASAQVISHYLKLAASQTNIDLQLAEQQLALLRAKTASVEADNSEKKDYAAVIEALRRYNGIEDYEE